MLQTYNRYTFGFIHVFCNTGWSMRIGTFLRSILTVKEHDRYKLFFVALGFMLVIGGYTVVRTLKDSLFLSIVGKEYIPLARLWSIVMLIPCVLLFSKLVDSVKRYQLIYIYSCIFGVGGIIIASLLQHPTIGLLNTEPQVSRLFGWFIYLFIDLYNPFLVSVFWSFMHSITTPEESKVSYPIIVAGSKMGGMVAAALGIWILSSNVWGAGLLSEIIAHQVLLVVASSLVLLAPLFIYGLMRYVPARQLHGYEAAYQADKAEKREIQKENATLLGTIYSMFSGFIFLLKYPYALGMFGIVFLWEIINVFVSFARLEEACSSTLCLRTSMLLQQDLLIHAGGFLVALVGARAVVELLGERRSLILVPVLTGGLLAYYYAAKSLYGGHAYAIGVVYVVLRIMNYAFAVPLRERLYTATIKEIKFKSKSWIDSFGVKLAKGVGSGYNMLTMGLSHMAQVNCGIGFFSGLIGVWIIIAHYMGRTFEQAVSHGKAIGVEER